MKSKCTLVLSEICAILSFIIIINLIYVVQFDTNGVLKRCT